MGPYRGHFGSSQNGWVSKPTHPYPKPWLWHSMSGIRPSLLGKDSCQVEAHCPGSANCPRRPPVTKTDCPGKGQQVCVSSFLGLWRHMRCPLVLLADYGQRSVPSRLGASEHCRVAR